MSALPVATPEDAQRELAWREMHLRLCKEHPAWFLDFVQCVDSKTGERFRFDLLTKQERLNLLGDPSLGRFDRFGISEEPEGWHWQRELLLEEWLLSDRWIGLKARQIGVTWLAGGMCLHALLFKPGTRCLIVSTNEDEAKKVIARIWGMFGTTPMHLKSHVYVTTPKRATSDPSQEIEVMHPDGRRSAILALPSTKKAGHGETANIVILDEGAYQDYLRDTWKATFPVIDGGGQIIVISTGNGVSNELTGEGNYYHYLWQNGGSMGLRKRFLRWDLHPHRDEEWYRSNANALPPIERAQQYPRDPKDAFLSTLPCWFDLDKLGWYEEEAVLQEAYRLRFRRDEENIHRMIGERAEFGEVRVYREAETEESSGTPREPRQSRRYAIGADVATGRGTDFSAAYVIDLAKYKVCAEYHAKVNPTQFAEALWALGRWYNNALIAVEMGGGYGDSVINPLVDGVTGLKPYTNLYRHQSETKLKKRRDASYGFPMTDRTRPQVIGLISNQIQHKLMDSMPVELTGECRTFVRRDTLPSPRAQEGANDDRVMAYGVTLEMYRRYGYHEHKTRGTHVKLPAVRRWSVKV